MIKWLKKKCRRRFREWQIGKSYNQPLPSAIHASARPALIHVISSTLQQGGLLDRIKGIVSSYQLATLLGYDFFLHIDTGTFDLYRYLEPCNHKMVSTGEHIVWNKNYSKPVFLMDHHPESLSALTSLFKRNYRQYHVYCNQDYTDIIHPQFSIAERKQWWSNSFHELFRFSDDVVLKANHVLPTHQNTVGMHSRFMSLLGDFADTGKTILNERDKKALVNECLQCVSDIVKQHPEAYFIVVSDSGDFLNKVKEVAVELGISDRIQIDDNNIAHIDFNNTAAVLEKTVFDFYLLTRCSLVYQLMVSKMHLSQYARYATYISNAELVRMP